MIAAKIGVSKVNTSRLIPWAVEQIRASRQYKKDQVLDPQNYIGIFMDQYQTGTVVVANYINDNKIRQTVRDPRGALVARVELDRNRLWISRDVLAGDMVRRHMSVRKTSQVLREAGVILNTDSRLSLGRGTIHHGAVQPCWEIDLGHPMLGHVAMRIISSEENIPKEVVA
jgi:hypothetical protein